MKYYRLLLDDLSERADAVPGAISLCRNTQMPVARYRSLYQSVGADVGWGGRMEECDARIAEIISAPEIHVLEVHCDGAVIGFVELEKTSEETGKVQYLGLCPEARTKGLGKHLVRQVAAYAHSLNWTSLALSTRSTDHPNALRTYLRCGFKLAGVVSTNGEGKVGHPGDEDELKIDANVSTMLLTQRKQYDVKFADDLLGVSLPILRDVIGDRMVLLVTTPTVDALYGSSLERALRQEGVTIEKQVCAFEERSKNIDALLSVCERSREFGLDRRGLIISLGGGVCMDIASFAASMVRRGIDHIRIPTTLIGQVDAAVGLKGGVNLGSHKSYLGCFYPPISAIVDTSFLASLSEEQVRFGLSEIIKVAITNDISLFENVEGSATQLISSSMQKPADVAQEIIRTAVNCMLSELVSNPYERSGFERLVDFGHTFAHDLEAETGYTLHHGDAVAIDMAFSTVYAARTGLCSDQVAARVLNLLRTIGLPIAHPMFTRRLVERALTAAQKHRGGAPNWVVPHAIGSATFIRDLGEIDDQAITDSLTELERLSGQKLAGSDLKRKAFVHAQ